MLKLLKDRFKCTEDLWTYMTCNAGYLLPSLQATRTAFLDEILKGKKKVLKQKDVPARVVPQWNELSVKECYPKAVETLPGLIDYLPDPWGKDKRLPERDFFWKVMYALFPKETDLYISEVEGDRKKRPNLQDQQQGVDISEDFMRELLKHEYQSKKKGRGSSSIFLNKVGKGKHYKMK
jgi:hypothetical protein